jgi:hypothetical protein
MEAPHVSLLCLRGVVLFFRLKSAHRACGVAPSVGMRDGQANELQSTPCVTLTTNKRIAANVAKLPEGSNPSLGLNASQPQKQNCADNNNKQNNQLHGSCSRLGAKISQPHKGPFPLLRSQLCLL